MKILMMAGLDTKNQPQPFTEKAPQQTNGKAQEGAIGGVSR